MIYKDALVLDLQAFKNSFALVVQKANTENLSDHDVAVLRENLKAFEFAIDTIQELTADLEDAETCKCEPYDTTCWYAAFIAGFNAGSMAECPQKLEEFRASMNRDPYMDEAGGGTPSLGPLGDTQFGVDFALNLRDPDTEDILVADLSKVNFIGTDCCGDPISKYKKIEGSHTEHFKDKNRIEQQERRIGKLEGAIQQLWEDTKHD